MKKVLMMLFPVLMAGMASCTDVYPPEPPKARSNPMNPEAHLLILQNREIVVGMLPDIGGHVVLFRTHSGSNILNSTPKLWMEPGPKVSAEDPQFLPYNGHIYWAGPQKGWWSQQDLNPAKKKQNASWPPDPYLTQGKYEIVEQTKDSVKLKGPASPVSGLQLTKEIRIKDNKVFLKATATNIRDSEVSWDIWSNTRLPGTAHVYVPVSKEGGVIKMEFTAWSPDKDRVLPYEITDGFLNFDIPSLETDKEHVFTSKTFIYPSVPYIAAFTGDSLFIKRAVAAVPKNQIHPDHAFVEIYKLTGNIPGHLTELEMHGPFKTLKPGESMSFEESWEVIPSGEISNTKDRIKFLKENLK